MASLSALIYWPAYPNSCLDISSSASIVQSDVQFELKFLFRAQIRPEQKQEGSATSSAAIIGAAGLLAPFFMDVDPAFAGNPLLTGKTVSLIHPAIMLFLFSASSYTAWLGFQWR